MCVYVVTKFEWYKSSVNTTHTRTQAQLKRMCVHVLDIVIRRHLYTHTQWKWLIRKAYHCRYVHIKTLCVHLQAHAHIQIHISAIGRSVCLSKMMMPTLSLKTYNTIAATIVKTKL